MHTLLDMRTSLSFHQSTDAKAMGVQPEDPGMDRRCSYCEGKRAEREFDSQMHYVSSEGFNSTHVIWVTNIGKWQDVIVSSIEEDEPGAKRKPCHVPRCLR